MHLTSPDIEVQHSRSFTDYLIILARWRNFIFISTLIAGILVGGYLWFFVPNIYESHAGIKTSIVTQVNSTSIGSMLNVKGIGDIGGMLGIGSQKSDLEQYLGILQSESVVRELVERYGLQKQYDVKFEEDAAKTFREQIKFTSDRDAQILNIAVRDSSPVHAQSMCRVLIELLDSINRSLAQLNARNAREYLELRYTQCVHDLAQAEDSLRVFQIRHKIYDMKDQATASIKVAAELEGEIMLKDMQANVLSRSLGADDADTRRLQHEVEELKSQRRKMDTGLDLQSAFQSIVPFGSAPDLGMEYLRRYRELEIQQKLFALLNPMYEQAKVDEHRDTPTILVLDKPTLPERKVGPKRSVMTLGFMACVFFLCYVIALSIENQRRFTLEHPDQSRLLRTSLNRLLPKFLLRWL